MEPVESDLEIDEIEKELVDWKKIARSIFFFFFFSFFAISVICEVISCVRTVFAHREKEGK